MAASSSDMHAVSSPFPYPGEDNDYLVGHVKLLCRSFRLLTGRDLISRGSLDQETARQIFHAPFVVLSHNTDTDPILTYCNLTGLTLFDLSWEEMIVTPSRYTAEAMERGERARLLERVASQGFIDDYAGIRISGNGRRFRIEQATVWNLVTGKGGIKGQAATFAHWTFL